MTRAMPPIQQQRRRTALIGKTRLQAANRSECAAKMETPPARDLGSTAVANGFHNRENFKTAIYFHCGKLDLYPH